LPFIFVGRINSKEDVDRLMKDYKADYLAIGRGLLADHQFVGKYLGKVEGKIRPCLACAEGCLGGVKSGEGLQCVVNPLTGNEGREDFQEKPVAAGQEKSFAVVGGGPAGMEAALTLHKRGHKVELFEREELGGQLNLAHLPPNKESLKEIVDYYRDELDRQGVPVRKEEATAENLKGNGYNGVLLAAGAEPMIPPIKGLKEYYWTEFLYDENLPTGKRVVVIGGGLIGMELASKLVEKNNDVTIVEMLPEVATGMEMIEKSMTMKKLAQKNVTIYTNFKVEEIDRSRVILNGDEQRILEDIDHIVVTAGMRSRNDMKEEIEPELPVYVIGDAKKVGKAQTAILSGRTTALQL
ncbi:MAG: FAD-dependent oxidoreductase, partial [Spirochaetales bacterium]|nr:FAD-dependent oxidoreductase [Spirochaetales bacterium]MCF7938319.1 FAD-dependent oxidoreductase [Spirochaetales bacterium]